MSKSKKIVLILLTNLFIMFFSNVSMANVQNNVSKTTTAGSVTWYSTLTAAVNAATDGDVIEVYNSFTESSSVQIMKQNLTIKAANGYNPVISFSNTTEVPVTNFTSYHCMVVYTAVTTSTTLGGGTGTLTIDASYASDDDNKGKRARVLAFCGSGNLNLYDGIILKGGKPGGGNYDDEKQDQVNHPTAEVVSTKGSGAGILLNSGTLNMYGGIIEDCYSLWGSSGTHNLVGAGGGICVNSGATLNMSGGIIRRNAAGSGGGGGIIINPGGTLNLTGGIVTENKCSFASGGGIAVNKGYSGISISGGEISYNTTSGYGGGIFARGDGDPLQIMGGKISNNTAGTGGGVLFWTVGSSEAKNKLIIGGNAQIIDNVATNDGGGISIGRESQDTGIKCYLEIQADALISGNTAKGNGGGVYLQPDNVSSQVNTVLISGGTISNNTAESGAGMYIPGGIVTMSGGTILNNESIKYGGGIYVSSKKQSIDFSMTSGSIIGNIAGQNGGGVAINMGAEEVYAKVTIGLKECMGNNNTHIHPVIKENTTYNNGGGFWINGVNGENMTMNMYCGSIENNLALLEPGSSNIYQTGGLVTVHSGTVGERVIVIGGEYVYIPTDNIPEVYITYNSNIPDNIETKIAQVTVGVEIFLPEKLYTWENHILIGWSYVKEPTIDDVIYEAGEAYMVTDKDVTVYAVWRVIGAGEIVTPEIKSGKHYDSITGSTNILISSNSSYTTEMTVNDMNPNLYQGRYISFDKNLPNGTTILMIDKTYPEIRNFYSYKVTNDITNEINLTEFINNKTGENYIIITGEANISETFMFIVELPVNNNILGPMQMTLTRVAVDEHTTASIEQKLSFTTTDKRKFNLTHEIIDLDSSSKNTINDKIKVNYVKENPSGEDTRYNSKNLSIVLRGENLPEDAKLKVGTKEYFLNANGDFVVPFGNVIENSEIDFVILSDTLLENEKDLIINIELYSTDDYLKPYLGKKVAEINEINLSYIPKPAIDLNMIGRVKYADEVGDTITLDYETLNIEALDALLEVQKKNDLDKYETDNSLIQNVANASSLGNGVYKLNLNDSGKIDITFLDNLILEEGTYRVLINVLENSETILEVPYNFIILEE